MRNIIIWMFIFALAAGLAGCQLLKSLAPGAGPSLAERCADEYPCMDTTIREVTHVTDTIVEPYLDTLIITETVTDTVKGITMTRHDTTFIAKVRTRYVTRTDTVTKYLRVDTAKQAVIDSLNARIKAVVDSYKGIKLRGKGAIWGLLTALLALGLFLFRRKNAQNG